MAESPVIDQAVQGFVFQKRITESPEAEAAVENRQANVQLKLADATLRSEQGRADSRDAQGTDRKVVSDSSSNDAAAPALPLVKPLVGPADREAAIVQPRGDDAVSPPPIANVLPLPIANAPADVAAQSARAVTASRNPLTLVAPEIQNDSANLERPEIIWRKPMDAPPIAHSDAPRAAHLTAQGVSVAPADPAPLTSAAAAPSGQASGLPGTPARAQMQSEPVQVEQLSPRVIRVISERVMQAIMLDLKLERERRGLNKWR